LTTFATFFLLPIAQQATSHFSYQLPGNIIQPTDAGQQYNLQIFKQAGAKPEPVTVVVQLPPERQFIQAQPTPTHIDNNLVTFNFDLVSDTAVSVQFK
jgi:hypothetical protein